MCSCPNSSNDMPAPGCMTLRHFVLIYSAATRFVSENQSNWASRNRSRKKAARAAFKSFEIEQDGRHCPQTKKQFKEHATLIWLKMLPALS